MEEAEQFEHCLMLDRGKLIATGLSQELAAVTTTGKLDEAFTHYQGDSGHSNEPLVIPPRVSDNSDIAIEAHDLTLRFGDFTAVNKVSFAIGRGEIFGFLGSNGCGKTTTMKVLTGLMPATEGSAKLLGNPVNAKDLATRKRVGFHVPELFAVRRVERAAKPGAARAVVRLAQGRQRAAHRRADRAF
jgi:ribosome-dependent ATPase